MVRRSSASMRSTPGGRRPSTPIGSGLRSNGPRAVTRVADTHVPDDVYARVAAHFNEDELVALTGAVVVINSWNRLSISFRPVVGSYEPKAVAV